MGSIGQDGEGELMAMMKSGLIDEDDLLSKKERRAKQKKQISVSGPKDYWGSISGWKAVGGDDLLLGAEEGGFAGLEILENPKFIDPTMLSGGGCLAARHVHANMFSCSACCASSEK
jgi:hypothetical protein